MKITYIILSITLISSFLRAQQTATTPYSSIGLGENKSNTDVVISSMGGTSTAYISDLTNEANFLNPAANRNLKFTSFNLGIDTDYNEAKTSLENSRRSTTYLSNLSIAFPIGSKSRAGLNLQPYTNVGYDISLDVSNPVMQKSTLSGRGGLRMFSGFYSYNLTNELSLGAKLGYVWGEINKSQENSIQGAPLISGISDIKNYSLFDYTLAAAYQKKLSKDHLLKLGLVYNIGHKTDTDVDYLYSTYYYNASREKQSIDTLSFTKGSYKTTLPSSISLGASYGKQNKWSIATDIKYTNQSNLKIPEDVFNYKDRYRFALGGWVIPNINGFRSYFERVVYRYGIYYENTGININSHTLTQYGLTAGLGLPLGKTGRQDPSLLNLGIELGQRGTTSNGLIKENYVNFKVGFNFGDLWFRKRQYD